MPHDLAPLLQIEVQITCTCSVWGMQTTVEGMMINQAEESMGKFLAWAKKQLLEVKQVCFSPSACASIITRTSVCLSSVSIYSQHKHC